MIFYPTNGEYNTKTQEKVHEKYIFVISQD